jgi:hypothetical protein
MDNPTPDFLDVRGYIATQLLAAMTGSPAWEGDPERLARFAVARANVLIAELAKPTEPTL